MSDIKFRLIVKSLDTGEITEHYTSILACVYGHWLHDYNILSVNQSSGLDANGDILCDGDYVVTQNLFSEDGEDIWNVHEHGVAVVRIDPVDGMTIRSVENNDFWNYDNNDSIYALRFLYVVGNEATTNLDEILGIKND